MSEAHAASKYVCPKCGVYAACDCGVAPIIERAKAAVTANPQKSDRAIAADIGVSAPTVSKARSTVNPLTVAKRIGRDGKARKLPKAKKGVIVDFKARKGEEGSVAWRNRTLHAKAMAEAIEDALDAKIMAGYAPIETCPTTQAMLKAAKEVVEAWTAVINHIEKEMRHG